MNGGSLGPGSSSDVQVGGEAVAAEQQSDSSLKSRSRTLPLFPSERAEGAVQAFSRVAGPAAFFLALGGIIWWIAR